MGQELAIPDWARQGPAPELAELNQLGESLADGIGQSYPIVGYRGKQWSVRVRGTVHNLSTVVNSNGSNITVPIPCIDVVILGQAKNKSKSYYKKFDPNAMGERPICASIDGIHPDADVQQKQHDNCAACPRNVLRDNPETGRKSRECSDFKRLAVAIAPNLTAHLPGGPFLEPFFLRVPPASLNSLAVLGETMEGQGFHFSQYVTRIQFDPNEAHPKMMFSAVQRVEGPAVDMVKNLRLHSNVNRITVGDVVLRQPQLAAPPAPAFGVPQGIAAPQGVQPINYAAPQPQPVPATPAPQFTSVAPAPSPTMNSPDTGFAPPAGQPTPVQQAWGAPAFTPPPTSPPPTNGFGGATVAPPPAPSVTTLAPVPTSPPATPLPSGDSGAPEAADIDMDKRIEAMMAKMANQ